MISGIINVEVSDQPKPKASQKPNLITVLLYIVLKTTKNALLKKRINETCHYFAVCEMPLTIRVLDSLLEIMHCARNLQIIH